MKTNKDPKGLITKDSITINNAEFSIPILSLMLFLLSTLNQVIPRVAESRKKYYQYACVFVDHTTHLTYIAFRLKQSTKEIFQSKHTFKSFAALHNITIKKYCHSITNDTAVVMRWIQIGHT